MRVNSIQITSYSYIFTCFYRCYLFYQIIHICPLGLFFICSFLLSGFIQCSDLKYRLYVDGSQIYMHYETIPRTPDICTTVQHFHLDGVDFSWPCHPLISCSGLFPSYHLSLPVVLLNKCLLPSYECLALWGQRLCFIFFIIFFETLFYKPVYFWWLQQGCTLIGSLINNLFGR